MCGIAGIVRLNNSQLDATAVARKMNNTIKHRGPDGDGYLAVQGEQDITAYGEDTPATIKESGILHKPTTSVNSITGAEVILAHRRLSIIDIQPTGYQPMCNTDKTLWITHNGEIYNYLELKEELVKAGYKFHTSSDTEVILNAYKHWGPDCVNRFNGMWAFVIYDKQKNQLFASRDRFGVKPFYYVHNNTCFAFASEQKALLASGLVDFKPNDKAIFNYWVFSKMESEEEGMFKGILELFPSHNLTLDLKSGGIKKWRYYTLPFSKRYDDETFDEKQSIEKIKELLTNAVNLRLRSDVEVGSCLSGGIDSSSIVSLMSQSGHKGISTFTASFADASIDESSWAKIVSDAMQTKAHLVKPTGAELLKDLHDLIYCQDIPIWSTSTYAQFRVMNLIKQNNIKVVLDGQGGDELFAGYENYYFYYLHDILKNKGRAAFLQEMRKLNPPAKKYLKQLVMKEYMQSLHGKNQMKARASVHKELKYLNKDFVEANVGELDKESERLESVNEALAHDFYNTLLKSYLKCEDRCSMWHSVESRTPFSDDIDLIEYAFSIPSKYKIQQGKLKPLLREAMRGIVPQQVLDRKDKKGYNTPNGKWISEIKDEVRSVFENPLVGEYMNTKKLLKDYDLLFNQPEKPDNGRIFKLIAFPMWLTIFSKSK